MSSVTPTLGCPPAAFRENDSVSALLRGSPPAESSPWICDALPTICEDRRTELTVDGALQLSDCLGIISMHVFIEDVQKEEVQGTDVE